MRSYRKPAAKEGKPFSRRKLFGAIGAGIGAALQADALLKPAYPQPKGNLPERPLDKSEEGMLRRVAIIYDGYQLPQLRRRENNSRMLAAGNTGLSVGTSYIAGRALGKFVDKKISRRSLIGEMALTTFFAGAAHQISRAKKAFSQETKGELDSLANELEKTGYLVARTSHLPEFAEMLRDAGTMSRPKDARTIIIANAHGFVHSKPEIGSCISGIDSFLPMVELGRMLKKIPGQKLAMSTSCKFDDKHLVSKGGSASTAVFSLNKDAESNSLPGAPFYSALRQGLRHGNVVEGTINAEKRLFAQAPALTRYHTLTKSSRLKHSGSAKFEL